MKRHRKTVPAFYDPSDVGFILDRCDKMDWLMGHHYSAEETMARLQKLGEMGTRVIVLQMVADCDPDRVITECDRVRAAIEGVY